MCKKSLLMMLLLALLVPWAANAQNTLTVCDGTVTNSYIPIYGYWADSPQHNQMIYPATELTDMVGMSIDAMTFYLSSGATGNNIGSWTIKLGETTATQLTGLDGTTTLTQVYSGAMTFDATNMTMSMVFDNGYTYQGGNLLVDFTHTAASYRSMSFLGIAAASSAVYQYSTYSATVQDFLPKNTFTYSVPPTCPKPTGLNFALTPGDGTVATLSWISDADAWQICLNGDETNLIPATTNPYTITGLTPETTYTAKVRANCGSEQSDWSNEVTFTPTDAYTLTVNDGTTTNGYVPFYGYYADSDANSQFIIPADSLSAMTWGTIEKLTFYTSTGTAAWNGAVFDIYFSEVDYSAFETAALIDWSELSVKVYTGTVSVANNKMELTLTTPYVYMGGNLLIGFDETSNSSNYPSASWYGVTQTNNTAVYKYSSNSAVLAKFLPKVAFGYTPGEAPACMWPTNLAAGTPGPRSVELSWTENGTATNWQICVNGDEANPIAANTNPYTLTGLTPDTDYTVKVRANCGDDGYSDWSTEISFTTDVLCHAPSNLFISDITAFTANAAWVAETTSELRYVAVNPDNLFFQGFVTDPGAMSNGADASWIKGASTLWGPGAQHNYGYMVAEDFTVNAATTLTEIEVYGYQTGSTTESTFTGLYATIYDGHPADGGTVIWGNMDENIMTGTSFTNCYRGSNNDTTGTTRPVMAITASGLNIELAAGTYYLVYNMTGTLASGPWVVPQSDPVLGNIGDSWQYSTSNGWTALEDSGSGPYGLSMKLTFGDIESFDWTTVNNISDGQYPLTNLNSETTYLVQVRANCSEANSAWVSKTFTTLSSCLFPTDLAVSNIEARQAVLSWTENGEATEWEVEVVAGDQTTTVSATQNPFTLVGLSPETKYTVRVRSLCSDTDFSEWSLHATFTTDVACHAPGAPTVTGITRDSAIVNWTYEGDVELEYAEDVWRHYDNGVSSSILGYDGTLSWAIMLTPDMLPASQPLTHVAVYEDQQSNTLPITVSIYSGGNDAPGTLLYTEDVTPVGNGFHEFALNEAVTFDATQNLWIVCFSEDQYPAIASSNTGTTNGGWTSLDSGTTWDNYSSSYTWMIRAGFGDAIWVAVNNPASPQTITGLTPETNYVVRLRAVCGGEDGESVWVPSYFTTDEACPAPTALAATPYALSAELSWEGTSESYIVSYRTSAYTQGFSEEFATSSAPTGWTRSNTLLTDDVLNGTTALATYNGGWNFGTSNGVFDSHARVNIYGTSCKYWLVTPAMEVPTGAEFSFDLALTAYSGTVAAPATTGTDDKFVVLVSTDNMATWTILRQWDNAGSEYVYNNIANTATGENVSFDFSAYAGQTVYVAFYGESTTSNADNNLHIDNVAIGTAMPAGEWMTVNVDEATATITGLTPETKYEWKVQGDCGDFGMSEESAIMSFTTTNDLCPVPTSLTVNNETITATTADLSWNGSPDVESFTVRYRAPEHIVGGVSEEFGTSIPSGWSMYTGLLSNVMGGTALTSATYGWNFGTNNGVFDEHARVNIYGSSCQRWLVTPAVELSSGTFTFDMALTAYSGTEVPAPATTGTDDKFVVLISTDNMATWTILRQWDNEDGSTYVYNNIANTATGEQVSIDLSAYVGQNVRIAFYGESTTNNADNNLHIDNVVIGNPQTIAATDWQTVTTTEMNVTLTGLTPETPYEAQVKADCSDPEAWSNMVTFTTLEQTTVTQTIALNAGWNWVSTNVEITLGDLQAALVEALPASGTIIKAQNAQSTTYNGASWRGNLRALDVVRMYAVKVVSACEFTLEGMPIDPSEHPITIVSGANWIGFPLAANMSPANAFAGFAISGDNIKNKSGQSTTYTTSWRGNLRTLVPGQGYIYKSAATGTKEFVYPTPAGKAAPEAVQRPKATRGLDVKSSVKTLDIVIPNR